MHKGIGLGTVFRNLLWEKKKEIEIDFFDKWERKNSSLASCTCTISWVLSKCCEVLIYVVKSVVTGIELNKSVTGSNIWGSPVLILSV